MLRIGAARDARRWHCVAEPTARLLAQTLRSNNRSKSEHDTGARRAAPGSASGRASRHGQRGK